MAAPLLVDEMILDPNDFKFFQQAIKEQAGIALSENKMDLVQSRLRARIQALQLKGYGAYRKHLQSHSHEDSEWQIFINLLTTNKTDFFREPRHFDYLSSQFLPAWKKQAKEPLKVWSAACSTGEEPYTLSMILAQHLLPKHDYKILASDIDSNVLEKAASGVFPASRIKEQVPSEFIQSSIDFGTGGIANWSRIRPQMKERISFKQHNLIESSYPGDAVFDLIFLRNVLIYFTPETIQFVVQKLYKSAKPGGLLFIGHSESLNGIKTSWTNIHPSIYTKA